MDELRTLLVEEDGKRYLPLLSHFAPDWWKRVIYTRTSCFEVVEVDGKMKVVATSVSLVMDDLTALKCPPKKGMALVERMIHEKWDGFVVREGKKFKEVVLQMNSEGSIRFPMVNGEATRLASKKENGKRKAEHVLTFRIKTLNPLNAIKEFKKVEEFEVQEVKDAHITFKLKTSDASSAIKKARSAVIACGSNRYSFSKALDS